ncbi:hypothetical protein EJF18_20917 [Clavispora lusitaniae]|uniref:Uncharacterized protein n=1 Tax=Clavispora lusitaniae TaxID=36911 RepID=A0ACD0WI51_CLALS|nr:hypothetical protein EJF14_20917 [Clavispora lusitaniae]QFZ32663.1 hypothetical protein EJF16_20917 [Clavispora lusitaniae]QFZ38332.1 hypothetical protein EJF15_20917 [Clavispora lusitaniae]QFZ44015.1 hypothetical protein EJF18_20917 [Clavispora lusitaniae]QFZ49692.1 hypothetical protein EJF17_20917 [Clavispora lusitaniae]
MSASSSANLKNISLKTKTRKLATIQKIGLRFSRVSLGTSPFLHRTYTLNTMSSFIQTTTGHVLLSRKYVAVFVCGSRSGKGETCRDPVLRHVCDIQPGVGSVREEMPSSRIWRRRNQHRRSVVHRSLCGQIRQGKCVCGGEDAAAVESGVDARVPEGGADDEVCLMYIGMDEH